MATVQTAAPRVGDGAQIVGGAGLLTLAVAALRFNPWRAAPATRTSHPQSSPHERTITLEEVSGHDHADDCWIVLYDRVYDITSFLDNHPGGYDVLLEYAGRDATVPFRGTGHSTAAAALLQPALVGQLPPQECIYRKHGGIILSEMPE